MKNRNRLCFIVSEGRGATSLRSDLRPPQFRMWKFEFNLVHAELITFHVQSLQVRPRDGRNVFVLNHAHMYMYSALVAYRFLLNAMAFSLLLRHLSKRAVVSFL